MEKKLGRLRKGVKPFVNKSVTGRPLPDVRWIKSKYSGTCPKCNSRFAQGEQIGYNVKTKEATHVRCAGK